MAELTIQSRLQKLNVVYGALVFTQLIFGGIAWYLISSGSWNKPDYDLAVTFQMVAMVFVPGSMAAGYFLFKSLVKKIDSNTRLEAKLDRYTTFVLIRAAMFETPFLFLVVCALTTGVLLFLYMAPVIFFVFLLLRPTPNAIATDLELSQFDRTKLGL